MIKNMLWFFGVGIMLSLALFSGIASDLVAQVSSFSAIISLIPLELRVLFFSCFFVLLWGMYIVFAT